MNFNFTPIYSPFQIIRSFKQIAFDNYRPLVICDIDKTFITDDFAPYDKSNIFSYNVGIVRQTDPQGFQEMLRKIESLGGKLIFLTARNSAFHEKTLAEFASVGLENPERFEIHYTNNQISKGDYLKNSGMDLSPFPQIFFIDDNLMFLYSVKNIFPQIRCYQFKQY